jgi:hypothetical protein
MLSEVEITHLETNGFVIKENFLDYEELRFFNGITKGYLPDNFSMSNGDSPLMTFSSDITPILEGMIDDFNFFLAQMMGVCASSLRDTRVEFLISKNQDYFSKIKKKLWKININPGYVGVVKIYDKSNKDVILKAKKSPEMSIKLNHRDILIYDNINFKIKVEGDPTSKFIFLSNFEAYAFSSGSGRKTKRLTRRESEILQLSYKGDF